MTPAELATLARVEGFEIGGHTVHHPILGRASAGQQREEITQNLQSITEWTGRSVRAFAYPNGRPGLDYGTETLSILRECGMDTAFTTHGAFAGPTEPSLERSRFVILDDLPAGELAHRLAHSWPR
jgi:peptidoglycan/xylan/chitin deacetylase (PgdA/CDA1 family)